MRPNGRPLRTEETRRKDDLLWLWAGESNLFMFAKAGSPLAGAWSSPDLVADSLSTTVNRVRCATSMLFVHGAPIGVYCHLPDAGILCQLVLGKSSYPFYSALRCISLTLHFSLYWHCILPGHSPIVLDCMGKSSHCKKNPGA